jgi:tetratricopeptide (TPR) repeat protein
MSDAIPARQQLADAAKRLERDGDFANARAAWDLLLAHAPENTEARASVKRLDKVMAEEAEIDGLMTVGADGRRQAAERESERGNWRYVISLFRRELAKERKAQTLVALGSALRRSRNHAGLAWEEAEEHLIEATTLDPSPKTNAAGFVAIGALKRAQGELGRATKFFEQVLTANPRDPYAAAGLAGVKLDQAEKSRSRVRLDEAKRLIDIAYSSEGRTVEVANLYQRYDSLDRKL